MQILKNLGFSIGDCVGDCVGDWSGTGRGLVGDCSPSSTTHQKPLEHAAAATTQAPIRTRRRRATATTPKGRPDHAPPDRPVPEISPKGSNHSSSAEMAKHVPICRRPNTR